jgi:hypothetical protein
MNIRFTISVSPSVQRLLDPEDDGNKIPPNVGTSRLTAYTNIEKTGIFIIFDATMPLYTFTLKIMQK